MKRGARTAITGVSFFAFLFLIAASHVSGEESDALKGIKSVKEVFDVRMGSPKTAAMHIKLIHQTHRDIAKEKKTKPATVLVFIGPAVKLVSKNREGFSAEDRKFLDEITDTISQMSKDGIKLELCLVAARVFGVDPASVLPEIKQVENGWISEIGYQAQGYSLVPVY